MIPVFTSSLLRPLASLILARGFVLGLFGSSDSTTNVSATQTTYGQQGENGLQGNRNNLGNTTTTNRGNNRVEGDGNLTLGAGAAYVESLSDDLAMFVVDTGTDLAGNVAASAFDFAKGNALLSAQENARLYGFLEEQTALTESTRVGNQQLASETTRRALELAEARTGSDSDRAAETVSGLVRLGLIAAAALAALFLFRRK